MAGAYFLECNGALDSRLDETDERFHVKMSAPGIHVDVDVEVADTWHSELFATVEDASEFHRTGSVGWSPCIGGGVEPLELTSQEWAVDAGTVHHVESSFFAALPAGAAVLDSALVMRDVPFFWDTPQIRFREAVRA